MARPEKPIDWEKVDEWLLAGCHGTEIAPHFDMHPDTFYRRVEEKYSMGFTEYSTQKKSQGDGILRYTQYEKAKSGDNTLLIWLGKNRLGQREKEEDKGVSPELFSQAALLINQINKAQESSKARKTEEINNNEESKS